MLDPVLLSLDDFDAVYVAYYQSVFRTVRSVVLDFSLAEDVTQDVFLKAYRARASYKPTSSVGAWLHTIALRQALSKLRWQALQQRLLVAVGHRREASTAGLDERDTISRLLAAASPKTRAAIALHYYHGYRYREIARMLRVPEGTVATRIANGLRQIRSAMEEPTEEKVLAVR